MTFYLDVFHPKKEIITKPKSWVFMKYRKKKWYRAISALIVIIVVGSNAGDGFPRQNSHIPETFLHTPLTASLSQQYYNRKHRSLTKVWLVQALVISLHGPDLILRHCGYYLPQLVFFLTGFCPSSYMKPDGLVFPRHRQENL